MSAAAAVSLLLWLLVVHRPPKNFGREYHPSIKRPVIEVTTEAELGSAAWLAAKERDMEGRKARIRRVCEEQGEELRWTRAIRNHFFLADHEHNLGYCRTPKVKHHMMATSNINNN